MPPSESGETPKYNLPPPIGEVGVDTNNPKIESTLISPEIAKNVTVPKLSSPMTQPADLHLNNFSVDDPQYVVTTTSTTGNPQIADDNDLIEREWVDKAKKIIEDNRDDPYNQSKEITLFKADYMKKRYNKVIKVGD